MELTEEQYEILITEGFKPVSDLETGSFAAACYDSNHIGDLFDFNLRKLHAPDRWDREAWSVSISSDDFRAAINAAVYRYEDENWN